MSESYKEIYYFIKDKPDDPAFAHELICPFCKSNTGVMKAGRDTVTYAHKMADIFILDRWYCGSCDKHFYTDFIDTD
jgi:transposase-like protein